MSLSYLFFFLRIKPFPHPYPHPTFLLQLSKKRGQGEMTCPAVGRSEGGRVREALVPKGGLPLHLCTSPS